MPDGEIELQVNAEGVEDAAGELDETATEPGGGAGGGGRRGGGVGGAGGRMVRLLGAIAGLLALIEPVLDVLGVVSNVLKAFVAPLAVVLLRALQPVLRLLLELLPGWINWVNENEGMLTELTRMAVPLITILPLVAGLLGDAVGFLQSLPTKVDRLIAFIRSLQRKFGQAVADRLPSGPDLGGFNPFDGGDRGDGGGGGDGGGDGFLGSVVQIGGGLTPFIDEVSRNGNVDLQ